MTILVTGGAGFIGSHTCVELIGRGVSVVIYDNFENSHREVPNRIGQVTGTAPKVVEGDVRDRGALTKALRKHQCEAVIHFAGLKAVGDSVADPLTYYDNNVYGSMQLLLAMREANVNKIVFSSSATVYGEPKSLPLQEDHPLSPVNPYGRTKMVVENLLLDASVAMPSLKVAILRYFNPVGSHASGLMGEDPLGIPNNLMPFVAQVAVGRRPHLNVFGNDYVTPDGTGVRDYVHVMDLAAGHVCALEALESQRLITVNLGTGRGTSVLELVDAFRRASGKEIPLQMAPRRDGDVASSYASADLAKKILGWKAIRSLSDMCRDTWNWQSRNPNGYRNID